MAKERLDVLMVEKGLAESRELAQRLIMAGEVTVDGQPAPKPGHKVDVLVEVAVRAPPRFVSRGGEKLEEAFRVFGCDVTGLTCLDVGASTGGFTDCLLQHGAAAVYAVDVGTGQLHWKLQRDKRVVRMDDMNARYLKPGDFPRLLDFAVVDVAFISLTKILPAVIEVIKAGAGIVTLIKPQFEAGREQIARGGVVKDPAIREQVVDNIMKFGTANLGLEWLGVCESPIKGPAGNVEFLARWRKPDREDMK
ncbi:MAG: TlyA family rRNA (cytidine-2'-O)-methyltransferase [Verrucomicrobia bacterium]|nr:TlyA family rRNA (cytidine-2'-O)-methyltransferase [Verrucomicrobiota bacterium]